MKITGTFEVKMQPIEYSGESKDGTQLGRMSLDKTFHGDLSATSKGEMLSAMTTTKGSAGYVVIEQTSGTLNGKKGSFILQHFGIMNRGEPRLILEVIPDSGTGELVGLSGKMTIDIKDGKHYYGFEYELKPQASSFSDKLKKEIEPYLQGKSALHFTPDKPLPKKIVQMIVEERMRDNETKMLAKKKK